MDTETLTRIAEDFPWASWGIWDDEFPDGECIERQPQNLVDFFQNHAEFLTPEIVLMGLNRSDELPAPFSNFHAPTRNHYDYRLKDFIQDGDLERLQGAYMTDLVDDVDPESQNVQVSDDDLRVLLEQLRLLRESEYQIVCFGNKPFDGLVDYFSANVTTHSPELKRTIIEIDEIKLSVYRVWFYGLYGANQDKVKVFKDQLQTLNDRFSERS